MRELSPEAPEETFAQLREQIARVAKQRASFHADANSDDDDDGSPGRSTSKPAWTRTKLRSTQSAHNLSRPGAEAEADADAAGAEQQAATKSSPFDRFAGQMQWLAREEAAREEDDRLLTPSPPKLWGATSTAPRSPSDGKSGGASAKGSPSGAPADKPAESRVNEMIQYARQLSFTRKSAKKRAAEKAKAEARGKYPSAIPNGSSHARSAQSAVANGAVANGKPHEARRSSSSSTAGAAEANGSKFGPGASLWL